jgi:hypothetical protein
MKKLLIKIVIFLILVFALATLFAKLIDTGLKKDDSGEYKEWNDVFFSRINADILIQGSSRAYRHISPAIIDSTFKVNSYNLGLSGYDFILQYHRFLFYLKYNKTPKYIIQNIDPNTLVKEDSLIDYFQYLPYLNDSIIRQGVSSFEGLNWRDFYIPLYKYHGIYPVAFKGLINNFRTPPKNNGKYKGFQSQNLKWDSAFTKFKLSHANGYRRIVNKETIRLLGIFLDYCKKRDIKVIFVYTPEYYESQKLLLNRDSIMNIFIKYSNIYHIPFLDYSKDSICLDTANFYNSQHLNTEGVRKFNIKLTTALKNIIN